MLACSIGNLEKAKIETTKKARTFVAAIKCVYEVIDLPKKNHVEPSWPSHIYFEDVNAESQFELVKLILKEG